MFNKEVANDVAKIMMYNWKPETLDYLITNKNENILFEKRISAFTWMPDGSAIILNIIKVDKTRQQLFVLTPAVRKADNYWEYRDYYHD